MKYYHSIIFLFILLAGCSSNSSLTGSFGNRKYTKGVFWDRPGIEAKAKSEVNPDSYRDEPRVNYKTANNIQVLTSETILSVRAVIAPHTKTTKVKPNTVATSAGMILPEPASDKPATGKDKETHVGLLGFILVLGGIVVSFMSLILAIIFAVAGAGYVSTGTITLALIFGCISIIGLLAAIAGLVLCIIALIHTDEYKGLAKAGLIIALVLILLIVLLALFAR